MMRSVAPIRWSLSPRCLAVAALIVSAASAGALDVADLPKPTRERPLVDLTGRIGAADAASIAAASQRARRARGGELAVAVVASTDGKAHREFATALFNAWQLGDAIRNDGVLIFAALDDRRVDIVLGVGIDGDREVAISQRIVDATMRPRFRADDPGGALAAGADACARELLGASAGSPPPVATAEAPLPAPAATGTTEAPVLVERPPAFQPSSPSQVPMSWRGEELPISGWSDGPGAGAGLAGGGLLAAVAGLFGGRAWLRHRSRRCARCRVPMVRLGESVDDEHLSAGERAEERVGSVDYDVWACPGCEMVLKQRYGAWFTRYASCPRCQSRTSHSRSTTLRHATYDLGGLVRIDVACEHCDYRDAYERSTPRRTRSQHHGGRFGSSGGFSSGGSSGGGGGRSSGRGGGGSW